MAKEQFSYRITKNGKLSVYWQCKQSKQQQLALARAKGNFKRGNERPAD